MKCVALLIVVAIAIVPVCSGGIPAPSDDRNIAHQIIARSAVATPRHSDSEKTTETGGKTSKPGKTTTVTGGQSSTTAKPTTAAGGKSSKSGKTTTVTGSQSSTTAKPTTATGGKTSKWGKTTTVTGSQSSTTEKTTTATGGKTSKWGKTTTVTGGQSSTTEKTTTATGGQNSTTEKTTTATGGQSSTTEKTTTAAGGQNSTTEKTTTATGGQSSTTEKTVDNAVDFVNLSFDLIVPFFSSVCVVLQVVISVLFTISVLISVVVLTAVFILEVCAKCSKTLAVANYYFLGTFLQFFVSIFYVLAIVLKFGLFVSLSVLIEDLATLFCQISAAVVQADFQSAFSLLQDYCNNSTPKYEACIGEIETKCKEDKTQCTPQDTNYCATQFTTFYDQQGSGGQCGAAK